MLSLRFRIELLAPPLFLLALGAGCATATESYTQVAEGAIPPGHARIEVERSSAFLAGSLGGYVMDYPAIEPNGWLNIAGAAREVVLVYLEVNGETVHDIKGDAAWLENLHSLGVILAVAVPQLSGEARAALSSPPLGLRLSTTEAEARTKGSPVAVVGSVGRGGILTWDRHAGPMTLEAVADSPDWVAGKGLDWRGQSQEILTEPGRTYRYLMEFKKDGVTLTLRTE